MKHRKIDRYPIKVSEVLPLILKPPFEPGLVMTNGIVLSKNCDNWDDFIFF